MSASVHPTDSRRVENSSTFSSINKLCYRHLVAINAIPPHPLSFSCFPQSPWRQHSLDHCSGDRGQVPGGAGGGGWFGHARARGPDGSIGGHRGGGAKPGAYTAVSKRARPSLSVAGQLLGLRRPVALPAPLQEVCKHLTFALHADQRFPVCVSLKNASA